MDTLALLEDLVRRASVTPDDAGCQALIAELMADSGFQSRRLDFGEVSNTWIWRGEGQPCLMFLGHTDVVPTGPLEQWKSAPFEPTIRDGHLYGRGAADMKASVAAMVTAMRRADVGAGTLGLLLTSDEEGPAVDGVRRALPALIEDRGAGVDYCLVGEPSSSHHLGDVIRIGRRGSLNGAITVKGIQGHAAFPEKALNPIHALAPALAELCQKQWDSGHAGFPPTSFQVSNIQAGTGAVNVIPGELRLSCNFRFNPAVTAPQLERQVASILEAHGIDHEADWQLSGAPFLTEGGALVEAVMSAVERHCGLRPEANTGGGTSDGRFVAPTGAEVVELGPLNASIHKIDEHVRLADVETLADIYQTVAEALLPK